MAIITGSKVLNFVPIADLRPQAVRSPSCLSRGKQHFLLRMGGWHPPCHMCPSRCKLDTAQHYVDDIVVHTMVRGVQLRTWKIVGRLLMQALVGGLLLMLLLVLSAYRFGGRRALNSAFEHSTNSGPWPAEVLSLASSRALAGGCWFLVLVLVAGALSFSHRLSPSSPYPYSPSPGDNQCLAHYLHKQFVVYDHCQNVLDEVSFACRVRLGAEQLKIWV